MQIPCLTPIVITSGFAFVPPQRKKIHGCFCGEGEEKAGSSRGLGPVEGKRKEAQSHHCQSCVCNADHLVFCLSLSFSIFPCFSPPGVWEKVSSFGMTKRVTPVLGETEEFLGSSFCLHSKFWLGGGAFPSPSESLCSGS